MRGVDGKVKKTPAEIPQLKPNEVLVKIIHSGLCGTDLFFLDPGYVLGHEGVGIVEKIGDTVTAHKVGDRVGGGYLRSVRYPSPSWGLPWTQGDLSLTNMVLELWELQILPYRQGHYVL